MAGPGGDALNGGDPEAAGYVREKARHVLGVAALRRLRAMVDRGERDEHDVRAFTIRALLWLAVVALSVPLAMFCVGATRALFGHLAQGRPAAEYLSRVLDEALVLVYWVPPWVLAVWLLARDHRRADGQR
jgi:hypothetical protein